MQAPDNGSGALWCLGSTSLARVHYPNVVLANRSVHFCGVSAHNTWEGSPAGDTDRRWGNRTRRLDYAWTPDIASQPFSGWVAIDDCFATGGWICTGDMHLAADGTVHLLYARNPMSDKLRDAHHPDAVRTYSILHVSVRDGVVQTRNPVWEAVEGSDELFPCNVSIKESQNPRNGGVPIVIQSSHPPRFHVTPDGRLFALYCWVAVLG